jgi:hypothetical protein
VVKRCDNRKATQKTNNMNAKQTELEEHKNRLREWFPKGSTIYTILRHVSSSGMSRDISVLGLHHDEASGKTFHIHPNFVVSKVMGWKLKTRNGSDAMRVGGCGMDMGYHLAHSLSYALYDDGYALKHEWL